MAERGGAQPLENFAPQIGYPDDFPDRELPGNAISPALTETMDWLDHGRPRGQNHWPALCLALIAQAEELLAVAGVDSLEEVFVAHPRQESEPGQRSVNTLNFTLPDGNVVALRSRYNAALRVIRNEMLREHPINQGHATQSWPEYRPFIEQLYRLEPGERTHLAKHVWEIGVLPRAEMKLAEIRDRVVRPFEAVLTKMPTSVRGVRGGALLQGIAYGYLRADSPNLILETAKVNTGSSRQGRLGDVDGFRGSEPELSAEVKDMVLDAGNAEDQLTDFIEDMAKAPNATAVVVCRSVTDEARALVEARNIVVLTVADLAWAVRVWDLPKQQEALLGIDYFLGRIQKSEKAQDYFRNWLNANGLDAGFGYVQAVEPDATPEAITGD